MKLRAPSVIAIAAVALVSLLALAGTAAAELPDGYNPTVRPDPPGTPTRVTLGVFLLDLVSIDDRAQEFSIDVVVSARWRDPRLASSDESAERLLPFDAVWNPAVGAINRRSLAFLLPQTVRVDAEGNVVYVQRLQGTLASRMVLHDFPADTQALELRLASYLYTPEGVEVVADEARIGRMETLSVSGWKIGPPELDVTSLPLPGGLERAGGVLRLEAQRDASYYLLTLGLPLLLISLMAWSVFWIDPSLLPSQVGIATASVFSLIAFRLSLSAQLPKVSYLTKADWFVLAITLLVFSALGEAVYVGRLAKIGQEDRTRRRPPRPGRKRPAG